MHKDYSKSDSINARSLFFDIILQDGTPLDVGSHILNDIGNRHTLTLPVAGEDAFGQYTCQAENQYGKSSKTTEVSGKNLLLRKLFVLSMQCSDFYLEIMKTLYIQL